MKMITLRSFILTLSAGLLLAACATQYPIKHRHKIADLNINYEYDDMVAYLKAGGGIDDQDTNGLTMLHYFALMGDVKAVAYLMGHGADPTVPDVNGRTALDAYTIHTICATGDVDNIEIFRLLRSSDEFLRTINGGYDDIPWLSYTIKHGHTRLAEYLIRMGADVNLPDGRGFAETPLYYAINYDNAVIFNYLLDKNADARYRDKSGSTTLMLCCGISNASHEGKHVGRGLDTFAEKLLKRNVDVNAVNNKGWTALHYAAKFGLVNVTKLLLHYGADPTVRTNEGDTYTYLARHEKQDRWRIFFARGELRDYSELLRPGSSGAAGVSTLQDMLTVYNPHRLGVNTPVGDILYSIVSSPDYRFAAANDMTGTVDTPLKDLTTTSTSCRYALADGKPAAIPEFQFEARQGMDIIGTEKFYGKDGKYFIEYSYKTDDPSKPLAGTEDVTADIQGRRAGPYIPAALFPVLAPEFTPPAGQTQRSFDFNILADGSMLDALRNPHKQAVYTCTRKTSPDGTFTISLYEAPKNDRRLTVYYSKAGEILRIEKGRYIFMREKKPAGK